MRKRTKILKAVVLAVEIAVTLYTKRRKQKQDRR